MKEAGYIILGKHKITGEFCGYTENSFSMGFRDTHVRVWRDRVHDLKYHSDVKTQRECSFKYAKEMANDLNKTRPDYRWSFYRVGSKKCPVKLDWGHYWELHRTGQLGKYDRRNIQFEVK